MQTGRVDEAMDWFRQAAAAGVKRAWSYAGEELAAAGHWNKAVECFEQAVAVGDTDAMNDAVGRLAGRAAQCRHTPGTSGLRFS